MSYLELLLFCTVFLLLSTVAVTVLYYRRMKKTSKEYDAAKNIVSDIVVSFNRQVQRQEGNLSMLGQNLVTLSIKDEKITKELDAHGAKIADLTMKAAEFLHKENTLLIEVDEVKKRMEALAKTQREMLRRFPEPTETQIEAAIPIKKDRALAPLTETELLVLETLADEGEKTAPEIKERIKLTREHTARLMKKLYESGYVERKSEKTPFTYRVKEEMMKILKKTEAKSE